MTVANAPPPRGPGLGVQIDEENAMTCLDQSGRQVDGGSGLACTCITLAMDGSAMECRCGHSIPMVSKSDNSHLGSFSSETSRHKRVADDKAPEEPLHLEAAGIKG